MARLKRTGYFGQPSESLKIKVTWKDYKKIWLLDSEEWRNMIETVEKSNTDNTCAIQMSYSFFLQLPE